MPFYSKQQRGFRSFGASRVKIITFRRIILIPHLMEEVLTYPSETTTRNKVQLISTHYHLGTLQYKFEIYLFDRITTENPWRAYQRRYWPQASQHWVRQWLGAWWHQFITNSVWAMTIDGLTHWSWVMRICVDKLSIIVSDNGLSPGRRQAIICTNAGILLIGP